MAEETNQTMAADLSECENCRLSKLAGGDSYSFSCSVLNQV